MGEVELIKATLAKARKDHNENCCCGDQGAGPCSVCVSDSPYIEAFSAMLTKATMDLRADRDELKRRLDNGVRIIGVTDGGQYQADWQSKADQLVRATADVERLTQELGIALVQRDDTAKCEDRLIDRVKEQGAELAALRSERDGALRRGDKLMMDADRLRSRLVLLEAVAAAADHFEDETVGLRSYLVERGWTDSVAAYDALALSLIPYRTALAALDAAQKGAPS